MHEEHCLALALLVEARVPWVAPQVDVVVGAERVVASEAPWEVRGADLAEPMRFVRDKSCTRGTCTVGSCSTDCSGTTTSRLHSHNPTCMVRCTPLSGLAGLAAVWVEATLAARLASSSCSRRTPRAGSAGCSGGW